MKIEEIIQANLLKEADSLPIDNFSADDLHQLSKIRDLNKAKEFAVSLITKPSQKPLTPRKQTWFIQSVNRARSVDDLSKIMWNMLMSGDGHSVLGTRYSTDKSQYRKQFGEDDQDTHMWRAYDIDAFLAMTPDKQTVKVHGRNSASLPVGSIVLGMEEHGDSDVSKTSFTLYKKVADTTDMMASAFAQKGHLPVSPYAKGPEINAKFTELAQKLIG